MTIQVLFDEKTISLIGHERNYNIVQKITITDLNIVLDYKNNRNEVKSFIIKNSFIEDDSIPKFLEVISKFQFLQTFVYSEASIYSSELKPILPKLNNLLTLDLSYNQLDNDGARMLADSIFETCPNLSYLNLKGNDIGDNGFYLLLDYIRKNKSLTWFNIQENDIDLKDYNFDYDEITKFYQENKIITSFRLEPQEGISERNKSLPSDIQSSPQIYLDQFDNKNLLYLLKAIEDLSQNRDPIQENQYFSIKAHLYNDSPIIQSYFTQKAKQSFAEYEKLYYEDESFDDEDNIDHLLGEEH